MSIGKRGQSERRKQHNDEAGTAVRFSEFRNHTDSFFHLVFIFDGARQTRSPRRFAEVFEEFDDRLTVALLFPLRCVGKRQRVASQLAIHPHTVAGNPNQGIEPMQYLQQRHEPADQNVVSLDMA